MTDNLKCVYCTYVEPTQKHSGRIKVETLRGPRRFYELNNYFLNIETYQTALYNYARDCRFDWFVIAGAPNLNNTGFIFIVDEQYAEFKG